MIASYALLLLTALGGAAALFLPHLLDYDDNRALPPPYHDPHFATNSDGIVHLFEWRWQDVAAECQRWLGRHQVGGVQLSPANENRVIATRIFRPWYERYQPVSYEIDTRSGDERAFAAMVQTCNSNNVRIFVDVVFNHMASGSGIGTANNSFSSATLSYPAVPYSAAGFTARVLCSSESGNIENWNDPMQVRNCRLVGLPDLGQYVEATRHSIVAYLNRLIGYGVAGFRVDAVDAEKITVDSDLQKALGLDSLDYVEIIMSMEEEFFFEIPYMDADRLRSPRDIVQYVCDRQEVYD